jgi:CheY-like chemotaxis protein
MKRIIIIEDNAVSANLYRGALSREGYQVLVATDGEAGLQAINEARPDLVVLDLMLPKVEGLEVLRRIRATPGPGRSSRHRCVEFVHRLSPGRRVSGGGDADSDEGQRPPKDVARIVRETIERTAK